MSSRGNTGQGEEKTYTPAKSVSRLDKISPHGAPSYLLHSSR